MNDPQELPNKSELASEAQQTAFDAGYAAALESVRSQLEGLTKTQTLKLYMGEMTAQETRTAKAAVRYALENATYNARVLKKTGRTQPSSDVHE